MPPDLPEYLHELYQRSCERIDAAQYRHMLAEMLTKRKEAFAKDEQDLGRCRLVKHKINTGLAPPV